MMNPAQYGEKDQELMLQAFSKYLERIIGRKNPAVDNLIRKSMVIVTKRAGIPFTDTRFLSEDFRTQLVSDGIDEFIKSSNVKQDVAKKIKQDCLMIYKNWKNRIRRNPTQEELELHQLITELQSEGYLTK